LWTQFAESPRWIADLYGFFGNSPQYLGPDLNFAVLDIGQVGLADANAISKFLLSHLKPATTDEQAPTSTFPCSALDK